MSKIGKYIREKTLKQVRLILSNKYVKDALTSYEVRNTPRFKTFKILEKKIENVV